MSETRVRKIRIGKLLLPVNNEQILKFFNNEQEDFLWTVSFAAKT